MTHSSTPDPETIPPVAPTTPEAQESHFSSDCSEWGQDISPSGQDKLLYKKLLKEGKEGDLPLKGDRVFVNYEGRFLDGILFDHSKDNSAPFEVNIGIGK